jgi:serine/threonine protein kinase
MLDDAASCPSCRAALLDTSPPTRQQPPILPSHHAASPVRDPDYLSPRYAALATGAERFLAGTLLAGRYRIVSLLGRGGMGEVYKADDLKLNQTVALKFLPDAFALDGAAIARFHNEVRVARHVAHPNVCRVFDIGEVEGRHFLSMEY